jgi:glycosyltransferase involved in cell wall biosynthesis
MTVMPVEEEINDPDLPACSLTLIVPCYNEESTLAHCIERVLRLKSEKIDLEMIIVDDCSTDQSLKVAHELAQQHPEIRVLHHEINRGKGAALRTGFTHAAGDFVGVQDADLEYEPLEYRKLLGPLLENKADVVFGSRYLRPGTRRTLYFWHSWMNRTLTTLSNMMTNLDISDMETCYKLFRRDVIQSLDLKEERFGIEPEMVSKVAQMRCRVYECAISYNPRTYEEGKKIGWKDGLRALYCILHYSANTAPLPMQLLLYLFIGGVSAVCNITFFSMLFNLGAGLTPAVVISFAGAALVNYLLCISLLFRHKARWSTGGEIVAYLVTLAIMGAFDAGITHSLVGVGISPTTSKSLAALFGFLGNFLLRKYLVFTEKSLA